MHLWSPGGDLRHCTYEHVQALQRMEVRRGRDNDRRRIQVQPLPTQRVLVCSRLEVVESDAVQDRSYTPIRDNEITLDLAGHGVGHSNESTDPLRLQMPKKCSRQVAPPTWSE